MTDGPTFERLGDELRERTDEEIRRESEDATGDAERLRRRSRDVAGLYAEALSRGDRVRLTVAGRWSVAGDPVHVGADFATVVDGPSVVDVRLSAAVTTFERASHGGRQPGDGSRTFVARLREFESTGEPVLVRTGAGHELNGAISIVAVDHLLVTGETEHAVPTESVVMTVRPLRSR